MQLLAQQQHWPHKAPSISVFLDFWCHSKLGLTLPHLRGGQVTCPALRPYQFSPMRNPNLTVGHSNPVSIEAKNSPAT